MATPRPPARQPAAPQAPVDVEEDDPYGLSPTSSRNGGARFARSPSPSAPSAYAAAPPSARPRVAAAPAAEDEAESMPAHGPSDEPIY